MPYKSKAQRRLLWAKVGKGEIAESKAREWEHETKDKDLPEKVSGLKTASAAGQRAYFLGTRHALTKIGVAPSIAKKGKTND